MFTQQLINGISVGAVYALIAVGFALVFNVLKFSNFSHGGVITVTAYTGHFFATTFKTNFVLTVLLSALAGGILAVVIEQVGFKSIRKNQGPLIYYFVSSITFGIMLENIITILKGTTFYAFPQFITASSLSLYGLNIGVMDLIIFAISVAALLVLLLIIKKTKLGLAIRAASLDIRTCSLMGVNTDLVIAATFFVAGTLAGVSGVFLGISYTLYPQLGGMVVKGFVASVIGGLGSLSGAVIGAFLLGLAEVIIVSYLGAGLSPVLIFAITLVFLMVKPSGISGIIVQEKA